MSTPLRSALSIFLCLCAFAAARQVGDVEPAARGGLGTGGAQYRLSEADAGEANVAVLSAEQRAGSFTFAHGTTPEEERFFRAAVASARPEARRLVELVDGLVTVRFEPPPAGSIGLTRFDGTDYDVLIDLGAVVARYGVREANAIVLHELGHVVDVALVPDDLVAELDRRIPIGESCRRDGPTVGACAPIEERFADTFSKWAMDDLGVNLASGYRILPPVPIGPWGAPLARLGQ